MCNIIPPKACPILHNYIYVVGIIATEDDTHVTIRISTLVKSPIPWNGHRYTGGDNLTATLQAGQTFQVQAVDDLTGTYVTSNRVVSVVSGSSRSGIPSGTSDHMEEMMPPLFAFGKDFLTAPIAKRKAGDIFRIIGNM
jgi:adhesin/invasin